MGHVPHLLVPGPWTGEHLEVSEEQKHHLEKVLRVRDGEPATYTDGAGSLGHGRYGSGRLARVEENRVPAPSDLIVVVAPPDNRDRARFMVEKLSEMGVSELLFLDTRHGQGRPPNAAKLLTWAASGLEQSRGAWLMKTSDRLATLADLSPPFAVCDLGGSRETPLARTVVVGPEGGWGHEEVPEDAMRWDLGDTVLRVETAALVAAARLL
jgi:16S rRNA (uracil1498-N3)-methyltransferase